MSHKGRNSRDVAKMLAHQPAALPGTTYIGGVEVIETARENGQVEYATPHDRCHMPEEMFDAAVRIERVAIERWRSALTCRLRSEAVSPVITPPPNQQEHPACTNPTPTTQATPQAANSEATPTNDAPDPTPSSTSHTTHTPS